MGLEIMYDWVYFTQVAQVHSSVWYDTELKARISADDFLKSMGKSDFVWVVSVEKRFNRDDSTGLNWREKQKAFLDGQVIAIIYEVYRD